MAARPREHPAVACPGARAVVLDDTALLARNADNQWPSRLIVAAAARTDAYVYAPAMCLAAAVAARPHIDALSAIAVLDLTYTGASTTGSLIAAGAAAKPTGAPGCRRTLAAMAMTGAHRQRDSGVPGGMDHGHGAGGRKDAVTVIEGLKPLRSMETPTNSSQGGDRNGTGESGRALLGEPEHRSRPNMNGEWAGPSSANPGRLRSRLHQDQRSAGRV